MEPKQDEKTNKEFEKQAIEIAIIKSDISYIKSDIVDIKQDNREIKTNHLPHIQKEIEDINRCVAKMPGWKLISTIIGIGTFLIGVLITAITILLNVR